ncbi:MAG: 50S ribosomal protein L37e [Candidatus Aenigmarchaeota archaeon]|nr:50S ribosomal protein L37e [Candidatus Aenigmarchaeota archaeon]
MGTKGLGGTGSQGKRSRGKTHIICRRCGKHTYHASHSECASCGYGKSAKRRSYNWQNRHGDY